ncbi:DUF1257 domain-containing protein [Spirochaeta cellobiosiphila]|uniref:DUF1257 domain-containing protein n=1 Tax=Spirochaeta cellobiosiphila TaxID=504483 RepID=UPI00040C1507|nr:DUF1257 domain-containing protein [Spirochaeta cellobiosiphila]
MSHFVKVETKITELGMLKKALEALEMSWEEAEQEQMLSIKGWDGEFGKAKLKVDTGCSYPIGINIDEEGKIFMEADWWAIETYTERNKESLLNEITRQYAYETVLEKVRSQGYELVNEEEDEKQQVRLVLRKWQ